jgi:hypothetical protein
MTKKHNTHDLCAMTVMRNDHLSGLFASLIYLVYSLLWRQMLQQGIIMYSKL